MIHADVYLQMRGTMQRRGHFAMALLAVTCALGGAACDKVDSVGPITRSSLDAMEEGKTKMAAGDHAAARELFAAAVSAGGLHPDIYCEARMQQATCAAKMGDFDDALAIVNELAQGASDMMKVDSLRASILSQRDKAVAARKGD